MTPVPAAALSLSTAWLRERHTQVATLLREARDLGFAALELYALTPRAWLDELAVRAPREGFRITSLHAPCPRPDQPVGDDLASLDPESWRRAVDATRRTIDAAAELGAGAVVVHLGHVGVASQQARIATYARAQGRAHPACRALVESAWAERERRKGPHLAAALQAIRLLGEYAQGTGVWLGVEFRDGYQEIPSAEEFDAVFAAVAGLPVGYWHDVGHVLKQYHAGLIADPDTVLRRHRDRLVGVHLHDFTGEHDHRAPGTGLADFAALRPFLRPATVRTLELSPTVTVSDLRAGVAVLQRAGLVATLP